MYNVLFIIIGSVLVALAYNLFLIPHLILSSGLSGLAIMLGIITPVNTGILNFLLNLPLLILGYIKLGRRFITYTILSVVVISVSLYIIPIHGVSTEPILSSLFGGIISGLVSVSSSVLQDLPADLISLQCFWLRKATFHLVHYYR